MSRLVAYNGLQAGPVCFWNTCLPNVYLKIPMFVAFAKIKNCLPKFFAKAIASSAQIGLACCYMQCFI